ncbi:wax ester synthase/diacylglycerol acyltransferase 11-like [Humulus lupulus]|uniref:wax ester synthase/diacylglycerol acyltransferase 11-like n=1 Tax=Humulus lupulus TaxID=3486 RepID=UPI002B412BCF|nr:wax ester synthase/diacylglycerol acyltransferase 11-like [Humulus lupulus]
MDESHCEAGMRLRPIQTKFEKRGPTTSNGGSDDHHQEMMNGGGADHDDQDQPLSPAGQLFHEPNFNVHILAMMGCKTKIDTAVVKANLPHTLLKHPRFCSLPVEDEKKGGEMKWVRTEVDLDKHVINPEVDLSNYKGTPDKYLEDYIHNLTKTSVDKSRPLWDLHILNVKTSEAEAVGIFRVHHSIGDGISLMSLLLACTRQISDPEALPTLPTTKLKLDNAHKSFGFFTAKYLMSLILRVWWVLNLFWNTFRDVLKFTGTALLLIKDSKTPIKGPPGSENNPRRIVYRIVSLDDMKLIKNAMNTTINDVALGATQAGLSKYLNRRYGILNKNDVGETEKKNNLPKKIRLRSILFINIRPSPGIQALADMMEKNTKAKWGNSFAYVLLPFTIGLRDDPLDYVREAKSTIDRKKHSLEAYFTFSIIGLVFKFFGIKSASALFQRLFCGTTMAFSNVVGPLEEIGFYGHPMAYLSANSYGQANELVVCIQSYVNKMSVSVAVDESTIPDPHQLCDDIVESLKVIKDIVKEKGLI